MGPVIGSRALGTLGTSLSAIFPCLLGLKNSGDRVQNLVPRVPYGVPTLMIILHRKLANFKRVQGRYGWALRDNLWGVLKSSRATLSGSNGSGGGCDE